MSNEPEKNEPVSKPFVKIVGDGCEVMMMVEDIHDIDIAHKAIDLAFTRYKTKRDEIVGYAESEEH